MFIYLVHAASYPAQTDIARLAEKFGDMVPYGQYIAMKTADNVIVPWTISQTDFLASDWYVVD